MKRIILFFILQACYPVANGQVIITEFLADPTPVVGLPEVEFIEIRNISNGEITLEGWEISDKVTRVAFGNVIIPADTALIVVAEESVGLYENSVLVAGLSKWPVLNNTGDVLQIHDPHGNLIDSIAYDGSWIGFSDSGGRSYERIDLKHTCVIPGNWALSIDAKGGTPGKMNSVNSNNPDLRGPELEYSFSFDLRSIYAVFNEPVDRKFIDSRNFRIENTHTIEQINITNRGDTIIIWVDPVLKRAGNYSLIAKDIRDCSGNLASSEVKVMLPFPVESGNFVINEILFDPFPGKTDFIELLNTSDFFVYAGGIQIGFRDIRDVEIEKFNWKGGLNKIVDPGGLVLLSKEPESQMSFYGISGKAVLGKINLFNIPNTGGILTLRLSGILMDSVRVDPEFHHSLAGDTEGYSLERTNPLTAGWNAAAWNTSSRMATPGGKNAQQLFPVDTAGIVNIFPEILTPMANQNNSLYIRMNLPISGISGTIWIFDLYGFKVATLAQNQFFDLQHVVRWDGTDDHGTILPRGYYILHCLMYGPHGYRKTVRLRVIISR